MSKSSIVWPGYRTGRMDGVVQHGNTPAHSGAKNEGMVKQRDKKSDLLRNQ